MSRYILKDDEGEPVVPRVVVDTTNATGKWEEARDWDGTNHVGRSSGSCFTWDTLYRSARGRYYMEHRSQWQGTLPEVTAMEQRDAAVWLLANDHELPVELKALSAELVE